MSNITTKTESFPKREHHIIFDFGSETLCGLTVGAPKVMYGLCLKDCGESSISWFLNGGYDSFHETIWIPCKTCFNHPAFAMKLLAQTNL